MRIKLRVITFTKNIFMQKPSVIFMGTPDFAVAPLKAILENGNEIKAVVTVSDKPSGRGQKVHKSAVKRFAEENNIKTLQPLKLKDPHFLAELKSLDADIFVVIAFRMLPREVWQMPKLGTFNIHGSLLPNYRGAAPINWAIMNGEEKTGVTSFFIDEEIDSGKMIDFIETPISEVDSAGTLHDKLMQNAATLAVNTVNAIAEGIVIPKKQVLTGIEKAAPKIFKADCEINWNESAQNIYNFVRGLSPYPVAWTPIFEEEKRIGQMRIYKSAILNETHSEKLGKVIFKDGKMLISIVGGFLEILEIQWPNKRKMDMKSFLNGFRVLTNLSVLGR